MTKTKPKSRQAPTRKPKTISTSVALTPPATHKVADVVEQYARDVVSGAELAGPLVRLAGKRHLDDLENGHKRGLVWDYQAAQHALGFFPKVLTVEVNDEAVPFNLHCSQSFIVGSLFGWKIAAGSRRFRIAYIEEGKGNGKSPLAAGIGLYMLTADKALRAEVYSAAVDKDQARILFRDAVAMVDRSPVLSTKIQRSGGIGREWRLMYLKTMSFFCPISSESTGRGKSGTRVHCGLLDEVHEHPTNAMVEHMIAGTKGRKQALILLITNSGVVDVTSVCYQYHVFSERLLTGRETNDSRFVYVCGLDLPDKARGIAGDDWADPSVWKKANPLLGISISHRYIEEQVHDAKGMPSKQALIQLLNCCMWVESASPFIDTATWNANGGAVDAEALRGRSCVGAIDLSGKNDLSSVTLLFDADEDGKQDVLQFFWKPEATLRQQSERDRAPYQQWVDEELIIATPGKVIDYGFIAVKMGELVRDYDVRAWAFDRWRIDHLEKELNDEGLGNMNTTEEAEIRLVPHAQSFQDMNPSIEALEDKLLTETIRHGDNTVLTWCIENVRVVMNGQNLRMFDKQKSKGRIDGAVSLCMAAGLSVSFAPTPKGNYAVTIIE